MSEPGVTAARLRTPEEVAQRWALRKSQVYRLARDGHVRCVRLGRYVRFREEDLQEFEASGGWAADGE